MTTRSTFISGMVFAAAVVTAGCDGKRATTDDGPSAQPKGQKDLPPGLDLRLSNACRTTDCRKPSVAARATR